MTLARSVKTLSAVTVATTATQLGTGAGGAAVGGLMLQAPSTNTASIYVGDSSVATTTGLEIQPGKGLTIPAQDESTVYAVVATGTQNLRVMKLI